MLKTYRLIIFTILLSMLFSGCTIKKWADDMWRDNKLIIFGGIIVFIVFIFILIRLLRKSRNEDIDLIDDNEQEFSIAEELNEEDPNYKTEYLDLDSANIEEEVKIEKPVQTNSISVSIKGEKIGTFNITDEGSIIGRDPSVSTIVISEAIVSKTHLKITPKDDDFIIEDLNSTNGTYVDGEQINKTIISREDTILLGKKGNILIKFD